MLNYFNALSIDVALGSVAGGYLAVLLTGAELPSSWWLVLPLTVWGIYTLDHLIDLHLLKSSVVSPRRILHKNLYLPLVVLTIFSLGSSLWLALTRFPPALIYFGLCMGCATIFHLALSHLSKLYPKELGIALIYCAGIWGGPLLLSKNSLFSGSCLTAIGSFFLLVLSNLLMFSVYEYDVDRREGYNSLAHKLGAANTTSIVKFMIVLAIILAVLVFEAAVSLVLLGMIGVTFLVFSKPQRFEVSYRWLSDSVFLYPFLLLLL